ncbi:MAG: hypothetical protein KDB22_11245 [Planctomycetales bacterium]|nr:hypothetical protein [Planctomycetales bacterium]
MNLGDHCENPPDVANRQPGNIHNSSGRDQSFAEQPSLDSETLGREGPSRPAELPVAIDMEHSTFGDASKKLHGFMRSVADLKDRTVRSASVLAAGLVRGESSNWLLPMAFRNAKSYAAFVRATLDSLVGDLGSVRRVFGVKEDRDDEQEDLVRRTVGNLLDMAATATFHVSPLTVSAIVSDIVYECGGYLQELCERLKEQHILEAGIQVRNSIELMDALELATQHAAKTFAQPPLSLEGLKRTIAETRELQRLDSCLLPPTRQEISQLWRQIELAAISQHASAWDVSATITLHALNRLRESEQTSHDLLELSGNMYERRILDHYWIALRVLEKKGLIGTLSDESLPYLNAVWSKYSIDRKSWPRLRLSGELLKWRWSQLSWPGRSRGSQP